MLLFSDRQRELDELLELSLSFGWHVDPFVAKEACAWAVQIIAESERVHVKRMQIRFVLLFVIIRGELSVNRTSQVKVNWTGRVRAWK